MQRNEVYYIAMIENENPSLKSSTENILACYT